MKIVNQSAVLLPHDRHPYEFISDVAHTCYKADPFDPEHARELATKFVGCLKNSGHMSVLEHEYVYFFLDDMAMAQFMTNPPQSLKYINITDNYISASLRAWIEFIPWCVGAVDMEIFRLLSQEFPELFKPNGEIEPLSDDMGFVGLISRESLIRVKPEGIMDLIPHTVRFTTNRAVANELTRHRLIAVSQESTRYVGYDKDKFGGQIEVITPMLNTESSAYNDWHYAMLMAETQYMNLRKDGIKPEIARGVLPNDTKTELVVTATETEWQHIINLRYIGTTGTPHPQIKELIGLALPMLQKESNNRIKGGN